MLNVKMLDSTDAKKEEEDFLIDSWRISNEVIHTAFEECAKGMYHGTAMVTSDMYQFDMDEVKEILKKHTPIRLEEAGDTGSAIWIRYHMTEKAIRALHTLHR